MHGLQLPAIAKGLSRAGGLLLQQGQTRLNDLALAEAEGLAEGVEPGRTAVIRMTRAGAGAQLSGITTGCPAVAGRAAWRQR